MLQPLIQMFLSGRQWLNSGGALEWLEGDEKPPTIWDITGQRAASPPPCSWRQC